MNLPFDEERWAPDRGAIEREKNAARTWLAGRNRDAAELVGKTAPASRRPVKPIRFSAVAATGIAVLFLGFLLLRPVFRSLSSVFPGTAESIRTVFERVQSESAPSASLPAILNEAAASEAAWSIQRVLCDAALEDSLERGLPGLIQNGLEALRREDESQTNETIRRGPRRSNLSETLLRFFQSIKEG
jgi:hypothetical protein